MSEKKEIAFTAEDVRNVVNSTFPDLRCLRCGHDTFFFDTDIPGGALLVFLVNAQSNDPEKRARAAEMDFKSEATLVCESCGFVERHRLTPLLMRQKKKTPGE